MVNDTIKAILVAGAVLFVLIITATVCIIQINGNGFNKQAVVQPTPTPTPVPTQQPVTIVNAITSPMTFTVLKSSAAQSGSSNPLDREYSVLTTDGDVMVLPNYYSWDELIPEQSYTCTVSNVLSNYGRNVYSVSNCKLYTYSRIVQIYPDASDNMNRYDCYDHVSGKFNRWCGYVEDYNENEWYTWDGDPYVFYYYNNKYWRCAAGDCEIVNRNRVPYWAHVYDEKPDHIP